VIAQAPALTAFVFDETLNPAPGRRQITAADVAPS
jgi:hypothetical protein